MDIPAKRKGTTVSMRFRDYDLAIIDQGALALGLSRAELVRRAALREAGGDTQRIAPSPFSKAYDGFLKMIDAAPAALPPKASERLRRRVR